MKKILNYILLDCGSANHLSVEVDQWMARGWQPFGSPVIQCLPNSLAHYCQAIVVYAE